MRIARGATIAAVLAGAAALAAPGPALAANLVLTPPGKAGANQYFETIPTSGGNAAPPQGTPSGPSALAGLAHGRAGDRALAKLGTEGGAAAALAAATAPPAARNRGGGPAPGRSATVTVAVPPGSSALSALGNALNGSSVGGLGLALPLLLAAALVLTIAYAVLRPRDRPPPPNAGG